MLPQVMRHVIEHFLYAPRGKSDGSSDADEIAALAEGVDALPKLEAAEQLTTDGWLALARTYLFEGVCACVLGVPKASLAAEIAAGVKARQELTRAELGAEGLGKMARALAEAVEKNETPIPESYLRSVPIPSYSSVRAIPIVSLVGATSLAIKRASGEGVPAETQAELLEAMNASLAALPAGQLRAVGEYWSEWAHVESAFVSVAVSIDTSHLTPAQRLFLPLIDELAYKLPMALDDGTHLSKDAVVTGLQSDTVRYTCGTGGIRGGSSQLFSFMIQVELDKGNGLGLALQWMRRVLYLTEVSAELLRIAIQRLSSQLPADVRNGHGVAHALMTAVRLEPSASNRLAYHAIQQQAFLTKLQTQMETDDGAAMALRSLAELRGALLQPSRMNLFVAANLSQLTDPYATLAATILPPTAPPPPAAAGGTVPPTGPFTTVSEKLIASDRSGAAVLCSLSSLETHFVITTAPGIGVYSPDHAALLVAIEYLTALEGDFWVKLRGAGLTYSYSISASTDSQSISFGLFKCTDLLGAYAAAKAIIIDYASGKSTIAPVELDGAKATVAYGIISGTATRLAAAASAWQCGYEGKDPDYGRWLLKQVDAVTAADALHALKNYIVQLFDPSANLVATCPTNKLDADVEGLSAVLGTSVTALKEDGLYTVLEGDGLLGSGVAKQRPAGTKRLGVVISFIESPYTERVEYERYIRGEIDLPDGDTCAPIDVADGVAAAKGASRSIVSARRPTAGNGAFSFAKQFACECPKCVVPPESEL